MTWAITWHRGVWVIQWNCRISSHALDSPTSPPSGGWLWQYKRPGSGGPENEKETEISDAVTWHLLLFTRMEIDDGNGFAWHLVWMTLSKSGGSQGLDDRNRLPVSTGCPAWPRMRVKPKARREGEHDTRTGRTFSCKDDGRGEYYRNAWEIHLNNLVWPQRSQHFSIYPRFWRQRFLSAQHRLVRSNKGSMTHAILIFLLTSKLRPFLRASQDAFVWYW